MKRLWPLPLLLLAFAALAVFWSRPPAVESIPGTRKETAAVVSAGDSVDPRPALAAALTVAQPRQRAQEFGRRFQPWVETDPEAALAYLDQLPRGAEFSQGLVMVLDRLGRRDPDRALALARERIATNDERAFYSAFFDRLARENIAAAIPRLAAVPAGNGRNDALRALTDVWVRADFAAAFAWAQTLPAADRGVALETTLLDLAPRDPLKAIELAQKNLTGPGLDRVVLAALHDLCASDPSAAAGLVNLLPPGGKLQTEAALDVARALGAEAPRDAVAWVNTLPAGNTRNLALNNALASWRSRDPSAAAAYVSALPPGPQQHSAAVYLAALLGAADPQNAIAWTQSLPLETRPDALANIVSGWAGQDPAAATTWAAAHSDISPAALRAAVSYWLLRDPAAAHAWIEAAPLSAEAKARLRAAGPRP